jgi:hypothetical protein
MWKTKTNIFRRVKERQIHMSFMHFKRKFYKKRKKGIMRIESEIILFEEKRIREFIDF